MVVGVHVVEGVHVVGECVWESVCGVGVHVVGVHVVEMHARPIWTVA